MEFIPQIEPWIDDNELKHLKRLVDNKYVVENILTKEYTINKQKLEEYVNNLDNKISVSGLEKEIQIFNNSHSS